MFGATEEEEMVPPITHVSVTLDGIPEVVEVHQAPDPYSESPETPEFEQPKKKKGKMLPESASVEQESSGWHGHFPVGVWNHSGCQAKVGLWLSGLSQKCRESVFFLGSVSAYKGAWTNGVVEVAMMAYPTGISACSYL